MALKKDPVPRFLDKVMPILDGCWLWTGTVTRTRYGMFWPHGEAVVAHRFAYELFVGEIPDGMVIDHLCRSRSCVNPEHLEAVAFIENVRRGAKVPGVVTPNVCKHGHPFTEENTIRNDKGHRHCRECGRRRNREYKRKIRNGNARKES